MAASPDQITEEREALVEALRYRSPQVGARLKVLLINELGRRRDVPQADRTALIPKLTAFLAKHSDLVEVTRGKSDILVSLRRTATPQAAAAPEQSPVWYRADVWQAFLNPDPDRRRFFHRATHEIVHFIARSPIAPNPELARRVENDRGFIEIDFAISARQVGWMRDFLDTTTLLPEWSKKIAAHFLTVPFESAVNVAFAAALGEYASVWKKYRATRADEQIRDWARTAGVALTDLQKTPEPTKQPITESAGRAGVIDDRTPPTESDLRATLRALIDSLDEAELRSLQIQLPASSLLKIRHRSI